MRNIAIATCLKLPEPDVDAELLLRALLERGARVRMLAWDDPEDTARADEIVVVRSTWNYFEDVERFLAWADRTSAITTLLNSAAIIRMNAKKTYLRDLESKSGIAIVPTAFVASAAASVSVRDVIGTWKEIVIKPVVSAGSFLTQRFNVDTSLPEAEAFLANMIASGRDAMVQEWMPSVEGYGERSLVWIDGEISHAIRKSPRFIGGSEAVGGAVAITDEEHAFATKVIAPFVKSDLLYARIDMVKDQKDVLRLMELELIEPSLFLKQAPPTLERLASAMVKRASAGS